MPISNMQYRASTGNHLNQMRAKNSRFSPTSAPSLNKSIPTAEELFFFVHVARVGNFPEKVIRPTNQRKSRQQSALTITLQLLLLLNQIRPTETAPILIKKTLLPNTGKHNYATRHNNHSQNNSMTLSPLNNYNVESSRPKKTATSAIKNDIPYLIKNKNGEIVNLVRNYYTDFNVNTNFSFVNNGRKALKDFYEYFNSKYPSLKKLARDILQEKIIQRFNISLDPDETYFMHFRYIAYEGDKLTRTGPPIVSKTLSEWLFSNFGTEFQDNLPDMNAMCGIYDVSLKDNHNFEDVDRIKINPTDFIQLVWDIDFYKYTNEKYKEYFNDQSEHIKKLVIDLINHLDVSDTDNLAVQDILDGTGLSDRKKVTVYPFDINGYSATNSFIFRHNEQSRITLYFPNSDMKFFSFKSDFEMKMWVINACRIKELRDQIAAHFSKHVRRDGLFYNGVDSWLMRFSQSDYYIEKISLKSMPFNSERFFEIYQQRVEKDFFSDIDSLVRSDSEVARDMWEELIDASNTIPNPVSPFLSLSIHLENAIDADTTEEMLREWNNLKSDAINLAAMVIMDVIVRFPYEKGYPFIRKFKEGMDRIDIVPDDITILTKKNSQTRPLLKRLALQTKKEYINFDGDYYQINFRDRKLNCIKINNKYYPVRMNDILNVAEVYDIEKPAKQGYPVYQINEKWYFGFQRKLKSSDDEDVVYHKPYLSKKLINAITPMYFEINIDEEMLSIPNSKGVVRDKNGVDYILFDNKYVKYIRHPLHKDFHLLGPDHANKITVFYSRIKGKFLLVPDEKKIKDLTVKKELLDVDKSFQKDFFSQLEKKSYRNGFRTKDFDDYLQINLIDEYLEEKVKSVFSYGLNTEEINLSDKYSSALFSIQQSIVESFYVVKSLKKSLSINDNSQLLSDFMGIFGLEEVGPEFHKVLNTFMKYLSDISKHLKSHILDDFKRVWIVEFYNPKVFGETVVIDPLERIFINLYKSGAYSKYLNDQIKFGSSCPLRSIYDDKSTIIHEASHLASDTNDVFYLPDDTNPESFNKKLSKMFSGKFSKNELKSILSSKYTKEIKKDQNLSDMKFAAGLFANNPIIRAELLMNNADTLTHIILKLAGELKVRIARDLDNKDDKNLILTYTLIALLARK